MYAKAFEERGWDFALYPGGGQRIAAWGKEGLGLVIHEDQDYRFWTVFAGDPIAGKLSRVTSFEAGIVALDFCERIAPLADWHKAAEWSDDNTPEGWGRELANKVLDIADELMAPDPAACAAELRRRAKIYLARADELDAQRLQCTVDSLAGTNAK